MTVAKVLWHQKHSTFKVEVENEAKSTSDVVPYRVSGQGAGGRSEEHSLPHALQNEPCRPGALGGRTSASHAPYLVPYRVSGQRSKSTRHLVRYKRNPAAPARSERRALPSAPYRASGRLVDFMRDWRQPWAWALSASG